MSKCSKPGCKNTPTQGNTCDYHRNINKEYYNRKKLHNFEKLSTQSTPQKDKPDGYIYIFKEIGEMNCKVGKSEDPITRRERIQIGNPRELIILDFFYVTHMKNAETKAHDALREDKFIFNYNSHLEGNLPSEWFHGTPERIHEIVKNSISEFTPNSQSPQSSVLDNNEITPIKNNENNENRRNDSSDDLDNDPIDFNKIDINKEK